MKIIGMLGYTVFVGITGAVGGSALILNTIQKSPRLRNLLDADVKYHERLNRIHNIRKSYQYGKNIERVNFDNRQEK